MKKYVMHSRRIELVDKSLSNKTNVNRSDWQHFGGKNRKERKTSMPCVNATDNHKLFLIPL